ncbi:MAG TPA: hypothetical protein VI757_15435 [Bacteroidia bacterium]|nr:hypothetical protein [Bacteroidia bacterium]
MKKVFLYLFFVTAIVFASCRHEDFIESTDVQLRFSEDTLIFDTVFTSVGSITLVMQVYNDYSSAVRISSLRLAKGNSSYFRLNVDGLPGRIFTDVEIPANDSIFIFCEVTIDPNNTSTPFVVTDSIVFTTNGSQQDVDLVAWGQNAHFHRPSAGNNAFYICNETWIDDLPHVIYGFALVDSACLLTIEKGTNIFLHPGSSLIVMTEASLIINGVWDSIVTFQGDRLDAEYREIPGQWGAIQLSNLAPSNLSGGNEARVGSKDNVINYAIIKNGNFGLVVDTVYDNANVTLTLTNTIIENMVGICLFARGTRIKSGNCVFANAGQFSAALVYSGSYDFRHCTFANFWNYSDRSDPVLLINNHYTDINNVEHVRSIDSAYFGNCIVYGDKTDEIGLDSSSSTQPGQFNFFFDNSLIQVGGAFSTTGQARFDSCVVNQNPKFKNPDFNNYELDTLSNAKNKGSTSVLSLPYLLNDIKGTDRTIYGLPDCGAYERPD